MISSEPTCSKDSNYPNRPQFDRCLRRLEQDVLRMGTLVEKSFRLSHESLFARNLEAVNQVIVLDKQIDFYYRQIEQDCTKIMTLQAPVGKDLRVLSAFMQLVRDLERIGDYAKDVTEIALKLVAYPAHPCLTEIEQTSNYAQAMLATSLVALVELDGTAGNKVKSLDNRVDDDYERIYQTLARQRDIKGVVEPILLMGLLIRHLERMADHATNIAQRVSYIVTGERR